MDGLHPGRQAHRPSLQHVPAATVASGGGNPRGQAWRPTTLFLALVLGLACAQEAGADTKTVCTITVNSADEKEAFRQHLPHDQFRFVELVERGRSDWLESACRQGTRCDVLVVSGHYDGGNEFFSDRLEAREFLPVQEMERISCSASCTSLFAQLKEVYLFGCNTLNPSANRSTSAEIARSLVRSGHARVDAERLSRLLGAQHGESSSDRMRQVFKDVPAIYGFSSVAPLGPTAAGLLHRHFRAAGTGDVGTGRASSTLLRAFAGHSLVVARGVGDAGFLAENRRDICHFSDDRLTPAQRLDFIHRLLARETAEVRMSLERIEKFFAALDAADRQIPAVADALERIARDDRARERYLEFARDADEPATRARMIDLARSMGWLTPDEWRFQIVEMIGERMLRQSVTAAEVDLVCTLNKDHELDRELARLEPAPMQADHASHAAVLACLGSPAGRARTLRALASPDDREVQAAQVFLRHRPVSDPRELRALADAVARMKGSAAQVRALHALASLRLADRESLEVLARLYPVAGSPDVQTAIAAVLLRADWRMLANPELVQILRSHRLASQNSPDLIDVLIRRLQSL